MPVIALEIDNKPGTLQAARSSEKRDRISYV
jgi:hypothetical protein